MGIPVMQIDTRSLVDWAKIVEELPGAIQNKVLNRTLNRVGDMARTQTFRALADQTGLKYGDISGGVSTIRARGGPATQAYELDARGGYLTLSHFRPVQTREGVTARPWGMTRDFRGAFIVRKLGPLVFRRVGRERLPIKPLYGPAIPNEMVKGASAAAFVKTAQERLPGELAHQLEFAIDEMRKAQGMRQ